MSHIDVIIGGGGSGIGLAFGGAGGVWRCLVVFGDLLVQGNVQMSENRKISHNDVIMKS